VQLNCPSQRQRLLRFLTAIGFGPTPDVDYPLAGFSLKIQHYNPKYNNTRRMKELSHASAILWFTPKS
jgi:hypothetical protein